MKTTTIPPMRVALASEFLRRGIAAIEEAKRVGGGIAAEVVLAKLEAKLVAVRRICSFPR